MINLSNQSTIAHDGLYNSAYTFEESWSEQDSQDHEQGSTETTYYATPRLYAELLLTRQQSDISFSLTHRAIRAPPELLSY